MPELPLASLCLRSRTPRGRSATSPRSRPSSGRLAHPPRRAALFLQRAIHAQRALLVESARSQHKELKFLQMLSLAYTVEAILPGELPRVGSFRCSNCGTHNDAAAERCSNCGEPRGPDDPDAGGLTLAVAPKRERPLPLESCGFAPDGT